MKFAPGETLHWRIGIRIAEAKIVGLVPAGIPANQFIDPKQWTNLRMVCRHDRYIVEYLSIEPRFTHRMYTDRYLDPRAQLVLEQTSETKKLASQKHDST